MTETLRERYHLHIGDNPDFYKLLLSRAVYNLGFYTAFGFLAYYMHYSLHAGAGYQKPLTALLEVAIGGAVLGTIPAGYLADRIPKKTVIYASSLFSVAAGLAFALAADYPLCDLHGVSVRTGLRDVPGRRLGVCHKPAARRRRGEVHVYLEPLHDAAAGGRARLWLCR